MIPEVISVDRAEAELAPTHLEWWNKIEDYMQKLVASIFQSLSMCKYSLITGAEPMALLKGGRGLLADIMRFFFFILYKGRVIKFSQYWLALTKSGLRFYYTVYFN